MNAIDAVPWNIPMWVKIAKYPINRRTLNIKGLWMNVSAHAQCKELHAPEDEMFLPMDLLTRNHTWRCKRSSTTLYLGKYLTAR